MKVADALRSAELSYEDAALLLGEKGVTIRKGERKGSAISANDIKKRSGGELSPVWAEALGVKLLEDPAVTDMGGGTSGAREPAGGDAAPRGRAHEQPPQRPSGAKIEPLAIPQGSGKRIAGLYRGGGAMLAMQTRRTHGDNAGQGIASVFDDNADKIAELWLKAAEESPQIAKIVNAVNSGGVAGDLVLAHVVLAASVVYILGAPLPDAAFSKYSRYRVVVPAKPAAEPERGPDGTADASVNGASGRTSTTPVG